MKKKKTQAKAIEQLRKEVAFLKKKILQPTKKPTKKPTPVKPKPTKPTKPVEPPKNVIDGYEFIHQFNQAVITEYYVGDKTGTKEQIGCMGTALTENYSCASHNMPCGTRIYIPSLKGVINDTGIFEVEDTGGMSFDFDMFISYNNKGKIGKKNMDVYVLEWGNKKMTTSYSYIINYFKENGRFEQYRKSWEVYLQMGGKLINFWKFKDEDRNLDINNV